MESVRHFDNGQGNFGAITEALVSASSSESYTEMTCAAWLKQDYPGGRNGIMGRLFDFHNGWAFFVDELRRLAFFATGNPIDDPSQFSYSRPIDLSGWTFVAVTYDSAAGSPQVHFYAGDTEDSLIEIGSATRTGGFGELGVLSILFGNVTQGNLLTGGPLRGWNGFLKKLQLWSAALSLEQLKAAMRCNTRVEPTAIKFIVDVDGLDPEPCVTISLGSGVFTVIGTTVETGPGIGCDYVPYGVPFFSRFRFLLAALAPEGGGGGDPGGPPGGGGLLGEVDICSQL